MKSDILTYTFMRFRARLKGVAAGIAGSEDAEDVIHDAFCRLWSRHPDVSNESEAIKLTYTAVRNLAIDRYRSASTRHTLNIDQCPETGIRPDDNLAAEERAETYETIVRLSRKLLDDTQYAIFRLHDIEGETYPDIAEELGMSPENVRMTLSRARKAIREYYRKTNQD